MIQEINNFNNIILLEINSLSQLMNMVLVHSNTGKIQTTRTIKENNKYSTINDFISYELNNIHIPIPYENNNNGLFEKFISDMRISNKSEKIKFKFFNQNFFERTLFKKKDSELISKIISFTNRYSWIIINKKVLEILKKSDNFLENSNKDEYKSKCLGKLDLLNVYLNPDSSDDSIYFGNFQTSTLLINKNTKQSSTEFCIDYLFVESGDSLQLQIT